MIEVSLLNIIGTAILGNFIAHWFLPIQRAKRVIFDFISIVPLVNYVQDALDCSKCSSFWLGLVLFHDLFAAAICSLLGYLIQFIIDQVNYSYE